ncbi:hypothetical protein [Adhaeribacter pallidiroseus]|uniref:Uncharacterized protein n=1 Tax=Adhaeribacter pallidiroseus TaxID=2072847 RepID=A0A369QEF9_9BACT|nr:hypothetical protein [Adhaeribacter pallidiroseus]RDC62812.1 hypothetical protein AHMF7616_01406 [Adhaeribacter pallidiroseus]
MTTLATGSLVGSNYPDKMDWLQNTALGVFSIGLLFVFISGFQASGSRTIMFTGIALAVVALLFYFLRTYYKTPPGVRINGIWHRSATSRGLIAWVTGVF